MERQDRRPPGTARLFVIGMGVLMALTLVEYTCILKLNNGRFAYTLDDPYIHMALAEQIAAGHYGINSGEPSAPSSSILWPFLLAPLARSPLAEATPLLISLLASAGTLFCLCRILSGVFAEMDTKVRNLLAAGLVCWWIPATNMIGLLFTGMEHSLQVCLGAMVVYGLMLLTAEGRLRWWVTLAIVAAPLVRYENAAISAAALLVLLGHRRFRTAAWLLGATLAGLAGFSIFLLLLEVGPLPVSVLAKSGVVANVGSLGPVARNFLRNASSCIGALLLLLAWVFVVFSLKATAEKKKGILGSAMAAAVLLHLLGGHYGWYHRYEIYIWSSTLMVLLYLAPAILASPGIGGRGRRASLAALAAGILMAGPYQYAGVLASTPLAASNIYEQHYQMHRIARAWDAPVAVNDLGFVSWRNPRYVLDLWGLTDLQALKMREEDRRGWMEQLCRERGVRFVMIYDEWFENVPREWHKVGELHLGRRRVTPANDTVAFYAVDESAAARIRKLLFAWRSRMPPGVILEPIS